MGLGAPELHAQKSRKINRNSFVIDIDTGLSYADFNENQTEWRPFVYPTLSLSLMANVRLNARIDVDYGLGGTLYYLINKSDTDRYVLDFASPYAIAGVGYNFMQTNRQECYLKFQGIVQLGYNDILKEVFDSYEVQVESRSEFYYSIKAQFGIRKFVKRKSKKRNQKTADEYGVMFRYSLQDLGTATFIEDRLQTAISPVGHIGGVYYKIMLNYGGKKIKRKANKVKEKEVDLPPIIYNPRY